jgi:acetyl esterase/lipase
LLEHAGREFGTERLLIGGESTGGHLAAVTLLRLRDRHGAVARFEAANLVYGGFDLSGTPSQRSGGYTPILSRKDVDDMPGFFLPKHDLEERRRPDIRRSSPSSRACCRRCSRRAPTTACSMTRSSWRRAGTPPATAASWRCTPRPRTASPSSRLGWPGPRMPGWSASSRGSSGPNVSRQVGR